MKARFLSLLAALLCFVSLAPAAKPSPQDTLYEQIRHNVGLFGDVYRELTLRYVDSVDPKKFIRAGIDGMLSTLDPYTVFFDQEGTEDLDVITSGRYGGVGIEIGIRGIDKTLTVISAMDDSPAQRVGIRSGDRILMIDTVSTEGFSTAQAAKYLRGAAGSQVKLTIQRTGSSEPIEFVVTRREIEVKDVPYYGFVRPGTGYIKLAHFSRSAPDELDKAIVELKQGGMSALILDLRGNPGGLLSSAVSILQRFCAKDDTILYVRGRDDAGDQIFKLSTDPLAGQIPLAVLVDGGSASASEIVAGAVQDLDRGVLIGDPTFGKGLVQSVVSFESGEALKLTTAKYYTPSGRLIQRVDYLHDGNGVFRESPEPHQKFNTHNGRPVEGGGGITPDIVVPSPAPGMVGTELWRQGAFFDFINAYRARHPMITTAKIDDSAMAEFRHWLDSTHFHYELNGQLALDTLRRVLKDAGLTDSAAVDLTHLDRLLEMRRVREFDNEMDFIRHSLEGELANNLFGSRGRIEASFADDMQIQKALEVFANKPEYDRLLAVSTGGKRD
ncbi:MAG TPA: S41 family peptidase [bacterium]|jgi:carboxyl-terminal processing protease